jgi:hypothetical protein
MDVIEFYPTVSKQEPVPISTIELKYNKLLCEI